MKRTLLEELFVRNNLFSLLKRKAPCTATIATSEKHFSRQSLCLVDFCQIFEINLQKGPQKKRKGSRKMKKNEIFYFFCSCFKAGMHLPTRTAYDFCISAAYSDIAKTKMKTALKKNTRQLKTTGKVRSSQKKIERLCTNHADGARKFSVVRKKGGHFLPRDLR